MPGQPVWSILLNDTQVYVHDKNCPLSVQSLCRISVNGTFIGRSVDKGYPIEYLTGVDEKFLTIMRNGIDPDISEDGHRIFCGSCSLVSETPLPFMEFIRSTARHRE